MGSLRVGHDWATSLSLFTLMCWRRQWQPCVLAWRIPGTGEPAGLPSMGLRRVGHDWSDLAAAAEMLKNLFLCVFVICVSSPVKCFFKTFGWFCFFKLTCFLAMTFWEILMYSRYHSSVGFVICRCFLSVCSLPFHSLSTVFPKQTLKFWWSSIYWFKRRVSSSWIW